MKGSDAIVVGAGVVGLASALSLARAGANVLIVEREARFGSVTSSRNSEVIHSGIYYPEGSLKAWLCVEGRERLYAFCAERNVPHRRLGKLIFAADETQRPQLEAIARHADTAGVRDLRWLDSAEVARLEPELSCAAALLAPSTGIVDSHALMLAMLGEIEAHGGQLVCRCAVSRVDRRDGAWRIWIEGEPGPVASAPLLVNAAGLDGQTVARTIDGIAAARIPDRVIARGCYFSYAGRIPFNRLIYPVPVPGGLGTHLTLDLAGRGRFGPNVEWITTIDYTVSPSLHAEFVASARLIWPGLDPDALQPDYAGIRPKLRAPDGVVADFVIAGPEDHGLDGLVNLFGIESPGLTASLAIGDLVRARLDF